MFDVQRDCWTFAIVVSNNYKHINLYITYRSERVFCQKLISNDVFRLSWCFADNCTLSVIYQSHRLDF